MSENIIGDWLRTLSLSQYTDGFLDNGYDDLEICKQIGEVDLDAIGVDNAAHRNDLLRAVRNLREHGGTAVYFTVEQKQSVSATSAKPNYSTYMYDDELPVAAESPTDAAVFSESSSSAYLRKYLDEYEEGKAELVKIPRLQLKGLVRDKLARDGIRLSSPPYSNADGSKGYLDGLAVKYAEEFKTHYQDVVEHLESLRKKEVESIASCRPLVSSESVYASSFPQSSASLIHSSSPIYKPGKYLPSSCLSDQDEEEIYGYGGCKAQARRMHKHHANRLACIATPQRCLNPKSRGFYDACHFSSSACELKDPNCVEVVSCESTTKKRGGPLGRILRGLALNKKSKDKATLNCSTRHLTPTKSLPSKVPEPNAALYSDGTLASREVRAAAEERMKLVLMVKDGHISMEQAFDKMCQFEPQRRCTAREEVLKDLRHGFLNASPKRPDIKETARFYTTVDSSYINGPHKCQHWYDEPPYESDQEEDNKRGPMSLPVDTDKAKFANGSCIRDSKSDLPSPPTSWVYSGDNVIITRTAGDIQVARDQIRAKRTDAKDAKRSSNASSASSSKRDSCESTRDDGRNSPARKNTVLSKFKSITSKSYSPNEESLSLSSDYEDQENEDASKKTDRRLSRDVTGRASAFVGRVKGFGNDVKKKISKLRPSRTVSESEMNEPATTIEITTSASSVESLPSGSGSSSVQALTTSSSNRSSTSVEEEVPAYSGPLIGKARALVDYTPSPYDKDALKFKKGDKIDVISMSQTGCWTGVLDNRVGHFKFINVEIVPEPKPRPKRSHLPRRRNSKRGKPKSVEELLLRINLEEHISVFVLNGYENLDLFKELEEEDLDYLGISIPEHRAKILTAVELLHDYDSPGSPEADDAPVVDGEAGVDRSDESQLAEDGAVLKLIHPTQSPRDSGCYASNENLPHRDSTSLSQVQIENCKRNSANDAVSNDLDCAVNSHSRPVEATNPDVTNACCGRNHVTRAIIETRSTRDFQPNILPPFSPTESEEKTVDPGETESAIIATTASPTSKHNGSRSQSLDKSSLKIQLDDLSSQFSTLSNKEKNGRDDERSYGNKVPGAGSEGANSEATQSNSLYSSLEKQLEAESIDLTQEPYTDKTGFCGIPAALVERYARESKQEVKRVASILDRIRLSQLQQRGRQGVPNDFLADACPIYEMNYSSVSSWLVSVGLPMYADYFSRAGHVQLRDLVDLSESDLSQCGIDNPFHLRHLVIEIEALNVHLQKFAC